MKKHALMGVSLLLLVAGATSLMSCGPNASSTSSSNNVETSETLSIQKLKIKTLPNKLKFAVGDKFTSEGLVVSLSESVDGEIISEKETTDYTLSIKEGTVLSEGEHEVMVKSNVKGVRSTSYNIVVEIDVKLAPLFDVISTLVETNNYTVDNTIGGTNHVKGLFVKDALIWESDEEAYFMDEGAGYGSYDNKTFRFNIEDNKIVNAVYLKDLGGNSDDQGLYSPNTYDDMAERRISNYNIQGISNEEINYLKNDCKPVKNNPNRYQIDIHHCRWLFNAIGHTQLTINPTYFLSQGASAGQIFIEVKDYGLDIVLVTADTFDGVRGCVAKISNIGTTEIPGMKEFLQNPTFTDKITALDILQTNLNANSYRLISHDKTKSTIFNPDYVYGTGLENVNGTNLTSFNIKEGNKINKEPGLYPISIKDNVVSILDNKIIEPTYLTSFELFKNLKTYFNQDKTMLNKFNFDINETNLTNSEVLDFLKIFTEYQDAMEVSQISIELIMAGPNIFQTNIEFIEKDNSISGITLMDFNKAQDSRIEDFIKTLY